MRILPRTGLLSLVVPCALATDLSLPAELFSPLVAQKILATAQTVQSPVKYPQYTDRVKGVWDYFNPDTWTSGFFPSTLYALHERASLCPAPELNATDWLLLGQTWSAAEVPSDTILASNTSSISITKIAASTIPEGQSSASKEGLESPARVVGTFILYHIHV